MIIHRRHFRPSSISLLPFLYLYNLLIILSFYFTTTTKYYVNAQQQTNHCFEDRDELKAAIDLYVADDCTNNSNCTQAFQDSSIGFPMNTWCTSLVTDFSNLFDGMGTFNEDISRWDTSNVTTMTKTFWYAYSFNGNIKNWDVSNVKDMSWMFGRAQSFDSDITSWNTGNVENMQAMFYFALRFNQPIGVWDVSSVENFYGMFIGAESFNQDLSSWSMTSATDTENMFQEATAFDFDLYAPESVTLEPTTASPTAKPTMSPVTMKPTTSPSKQVVVPPPAANDNDCSAGQSLLDVSITLDQYPADTRWEIIPTKSKAAVATSPPYDLSLQFKPAKVERICLEEGSYDFNIYDVYGDGICCGWGEGSYQLAFGDNVVASGGAFGKEETKEFSTPVATPTTESPTKPPQSTKPTASPQTTPQTTDKPSLPPQTRAPVTDPVTATPTVSQTTQSPTTSRQQADEEDTEEVSRPIEQPKPDEKDEEKEEEETCPDGFRLGGVVDECRVCGNKEISCTKMSYTGGADALFEPPGCACTLCDTQFQCNFLELPTETDAGIVAEPPPMNSAPRCHLTRVGTFLVIYTGLLSVL